MTDNFPYGEDFFLLNIYKYLTFNNNFNALKLIYSNGSEIQIYWEINSIQENVTQLFYLNSLISCMIKKRNTIKKYQCYYITKEFILKDSKVNLCNIYKTGNNFRIKMVFFVILKKSIVNN